MNVYKVTFKTGWQGGIGYDTTSVKEVHAPDFDSAYKRAKDYDWGMGICAKIMSIELIKEDD